MKKVNVLLFVAAALLGCSSADTTGLGEVSASPGDNGGSAGGSSVKYLTRGEFAQSLVQDVIGMGSEGSCSSPFEDVEDNSKLCRSLELLQSMGVTFAHKDAMGNTTGLMGKDDPIIWAEVWKRLSGALGWVSYPANCLKQAGFPQNVWYADYAGSVCAHGYGLAPPEQNVQSLEWLELSQKLKQDLDKMSTRFNTLEVLSKVFKGFTYAKQPCISVLSDVPNVDPQGEAMLCQLVNKGVEDGLIAGFPDANFHGELGINWAELLKLMAKMLELEAKPGPCDPSSCNSQIPSDSWYCAYAVAVCQELPGSITEISPSDLVRASEVLRLVVKMSVKLNH